MSSRLAEDKLFSRMKSLFGGEQLIEEEIKLDENCRSKWYRWGLREMDTYMKICSLRLKEEPLAMDLGELCDVGKMRCRLQVEDSSSEPPMIFGKSKLARNIWRSRLVRPLCLIIIAYYILKNAYTSHLIYKRDSNFKSWQPMFHPNATRRGQCVLAGEPHLESLFNRVAVEQSNEQLDQLGNVYRVTVGIPIFLFQFMCVFVTILYVTGLVTMRLVEPRCDHLNFIINPKGERHRIRLELDKIVGSLVERLTDQAVQSDVASKSKSKSNNVFATTRRRRQVTEYLKLLMSAAHLVRPANLSARWHQILLYLTNCFTMMMIMSQMAGFGSAILAMILETIIRARNRLERLRCQELLGPNGVMSKDIASLVSLEEPEDLQAYASHDGSFMSIIKLGINIESKYLITNSRNIHFLLDLGVFMFFTCIVFPTYELLYWYCVTDKLRWLNQVENQLECCVNLYSHMFEHRLKLRQVYGEKSQRLCDNQEKNTEFVKCLTISYLNYRLFCGQLTAFLPTAKVFISPMLISSAYMMLLSYIVAAQTDSLFSRWTLSGVLFFVVQSNFYLATGALTLSKSQKIMRNILKLLTVHQKYDNPSWRIIIDLWRRQLLDPEQLIVLRGINIFGNPISFNILKSLNFYLILLCCFLFKSTTGIPEL